jgi:hypothetical protein
MPRKEPYPYSHRVENTRKDHLCQLCGEWILKGSRARYKNLFTGRRAYIHDPFCPLTGQSVADGER